MAFCFKTATLTLRFFSPSRLLVLTKASLVGSDDLRISTSAQIDSFFSIRMMCPTYTSFHFCFDTFLLLTRLHSLLLILSSDLWR